MKNLAAAVLIGALAGAPLAAMAQTDAPSAKDMKGPPNANGFGKGEAADKTSETPDRTPSAKDMKGPPNANGYEAK